MEKNKKYILIGIIAVALFLSIAIGFNSYSDSNKSQVTAGTPQTTNAGSETSNQQNNNITPKITVGGNAGNKFKVKMVQPNLNNQGKK